MIPWLRKSRVVKANISLGAIGNIEIAPRYEVERIAHQAWVELVTRKVALPFEEEDDVVSEVYDSWYAVFGEIRTLAKDIPPEQLRDANTQRLVELLIAALNQGLRPHLRRWQARYRHWYERERESQPNVPPQDLQRTYPEYDDLVSDLKQVQLQLVEFAAYIEELAHGPKSA